jgi:hypothetical protein
VDILERYESDVRSRIESFELPDWIERECSICGRLLTKYDVMSVEVCLVPQFLGDLTFSFFCQGCHASFIMHLKCDASNFQDVIKALSGEKAELVDRADLFESGSHNIRVKLCKTIQKNKTPM